MLLKRLLILVVCMASACVSKSTDADVDSILSGRNYTFKFTYQGCFGGGTETLEIQDKKIAIYTFPVFSEADRVRQKVDTILWTREKEMLLREICNTGIQTSDTIGFCTTTTRFELQGLWKFVSFTDYDCALSDAMGRLVK